MEFRQSKKFAKELKNFLKKYRSLAGDLDLLQDVLRTHPQGTGSKHWNRLHVSNDQTVSIFKVRLSCKAMKGESRFRLVYAYNKSTEELFFIDFIEIYFKGEKINNDQSLIEDYLNMSLEGIFDENR